MLVAVGNTDNGFGVVQPILDANQVLGRLTEAVGVEELLLSEPVVLGATRSTDSRWRSW